LLPMEVGSVESRIETFPPPLAAAATATVVNLISPEKLGDGADGEQSKPSCDLVHGAEAVHLVEEKVLAHFSDEEKIEYWRWVLDTGATNHMTRCKMTFSDLDQSIFGTVKFGDGLVVTIEGMGTVIFNCKNGEHRVFIGVYFILKLTTNIISVGQLDEIRF
jgi:hypothetical protein